MASPVDVVLLPVRAGLGVAQSAVEVGVGAARAILSAIGGGGDDGGQAGPLSDAPSRPPRPSEPAAPRAAAAPPPTARPAPEAPATPTPAPAAVPDAEEHVETEAVLVAAVAEQGAEDGAGAEMHVDEPWDGYSSMKAPEVQRELESAGRETLAAVELYEQLHKARSSVLDTAASRLASLS